MTQKELDILMIESVKDVLCKTNKQISSTIIAKAKEYSANGDKLSFEEIVASAYTESVNENLKVMQFVLARALAHEDETQDANLSIE